MRLLRTLLLLILSLAVIAVGFWWFGGRRETPDPILVLVNQMRTRAVIEHERRITVWYRSCPEVPGVNPEVFVIWPGKLLYTLDLAHSQLRLVDNVLHVATPPIEIEEPAVPSDLAQFIANNPFWNLTTDSAIGNAAMQNVSPVGRYLSVYFLRHDPSLRAYFVNEIDAYLRGVAGALGVTVRAVAVEIPEPQLSTPPLPKLELCAGSVATANGVPFLRESQGDYIYVFPKKND
jgi:hypothetical protein